jgi:hypothetical protein
MTSFGCASARPRWVVRSAEGIPRDAEVWVTPVRGTDARARNGYEARIVSELARDGVRVRTDPSEDGWRIDVDITRVERCEEVSWFPRRAAEGEAEVTFVHGGRITDRFTVRRVVRCRVGAEASAVAVGEAIAASVAWAVAAQRHAW